mmetsp:Transcript_3545/g.9148  ORF Transcript_3545/g.9148 Transcript_3545/m.9148 type:complete len:202 (-) Transcript_3545:145-750(-)
MSWARCGHVRWPAPQLAHLRPPAGLRFLPFFPLAIALAIAPSSVTSCRSAHCLRAIAILRRIVTSSILRRTLPSSCTSACSPASSGVQSAAPSSPPPPPPPSADGAAARVAPSDLSIASSCSRRRCKSTSSSFTLARSPAYLAVAAACSSRQCCASRSHLASSSRALRSALSDSAHALSISACTRRISARSSAAAATARWS